MLIAHLAGMEGGVDARRGLKFNFDVDLVEGGRTEVTWKAWTADDSQRLRWDLYRNRPWVKASAAGVGSLFLLVHSKPFSLGFKVYGSGLSVSSLKNQP